MSVAPYRNDIQGLRGISILIVFLYHLEIPFFSGGYVGVDVFFVISGFVITKSLLNEYFNSGTIDLIYFYARRIKRLSPALFVTLSLTSFCAILLFTPENLKDYGGALVSVVFEVSNF